MDTIHNIDEETEKFEKIPQIRPGKAAMPVAKNKKSKTANKRNWKTKKVKKDFRTDHTSIRNRRLHRVD
jgi:hypothetical protein